MYSSRWKRWRRSSISLAGALSRVLPIWRDLAWCESLAWSCTASEEVRVSFARLVSAWRKICFNRSWNGQNHQHVRSYLQAMALLSKQTYLRLAMRTIRWMASSSSSWKAGPKMESASKTSISMTTATLWTRVLAMGSSAWLSTPRKRCLRRNFHLMRAQTLLHIKPKLSQILERQSQAKNGLGMKSSMVV